VTALVLVLLVVMILVALGAAYGVQHHRRRAGGVIGVQRQGDQPGESG
jgi:hypothetical protein